jgi:hypothetical protein
MPNGYLITFSYGEPRATAGSDIFLRRYFPVRILAGLRRIDGLYSRITYDFINRPNALRPRSTVSISSGKDSEDL